VIVEGTPEQLARMSESAIGHYLRRLLEKAHKRVERSNGAACARRAKVKVAV